MARQKLLTVLKRGPLTTTECATVFRAMADPTRLRIIETLFAQPMCVSELCAALSIEQHFASRHLAVLRHADLVVATRDAQRVIYRLHPDVHEELSASKPTLDLGCCEIQFNIKKTP